MAEQTPNATTAARPAEATPLPAPTAPAPTAADILPGEGPYGRWLEDIEPGYTDGDRGIVNQMGERLPGRLRTPEADAVWRAHSSDDYLHDVRTNGLQLPFLGGQVPSPFDAGRNSIKPEYEDWTRSAIAELVATGAASTWEEHVAAGFATGEKPHMIMPLIVEPKAGSSKNRLIHDCRRLNESLQKFKFKMEKLSNFVKELKKLDRLFTLDISCAYHHVEVAPKHRTFIGFRFEGVTYVYNVLPFGLTTSAYVFCKLTAIAGRALRTSGLVTALITYVDDLGGSVGQKPDPVRMGKIVDLLRSFGWVLAPHKMVTDMGMRVKLLGFMIDTEHMTIGVPESRREKLIATANLVLKQAGRVQARLVARLAGQIISLQLALGLICRLRSRYLLDAIKEAARVGNYNLYVALKAKAVSEVKLFALGLDKLSDQPIHMYQRAPDFVLHCDASDSALAAIVISEPGAPDKQLMIRRRLDEHEVRWSSMLRELEGYRHSYATLRQRRNLGGTVVEIVGDSLCCHYIFENGGSQKVDNHTGDLVVTDTLLAILNMAEADKATVRFRWVRRDLVQDADDLSKHADNMDFSLRPDWLSYVWRAFGPWDIDRFAATHNTTAPRFNSLFDCEGSEARDAFSQSWAEGTSYLLPDFHRVAEVLDKIERDNAIAVLIVPAWHATPWWFRLHSGAWADRVDAHMALPAGILCPLNHECFFGEPFNTGLLLIRTKRVPEN